MSSDPFVRYAELDPASDPDVLPDWEVVAPVLLEAIDGRAIRMQVRETKESRQALPRRRKPGLLVGAATFAMILAVAAVGMLLRADRFDFADGGHTSVVDGFAASLSSGATDLSDYVTDDAVYVRGIESPLDADLAGYWATLGTSLVLDSCEQRGERLVECASVHTNAILDAMDVTQEGTWTFLFEGDRVSEVLERVDRQSLLTDRAHPIEDYIAWLNSRHPEYLDEVQFIDPVRRNQRFDTDLEPELLPEAFLVLNAHNAGVLMQHVGEYRAELSATGGLPEDWRPDRWRND